MDKGDAQNYPQRLRTAHENGEHNDPRRQDLLDKIEDKLKVYSKFWDTYNLMV